jgi:type II secretion system protein N
MGWTLFGTLLFLLAWLLTFPYDALQKRLLAEAGDRTGVRFTAERWTAPRPFVIEWNGVAAAEGGIRFQVDRIVYELPPAMVLRLAAAMDRRPWDRAADLGTWRLGGAMSLAGAPASGTTDPPAAPFALQGLLQAAFEPTAGEPSTAEGDQGGTTGRIELTGATLAGLPVGQSVAPALSWPHLTATVACRGRRCRIENLRGDGPDGRLTGDGTVTIARSFVAGRLDGSLSLTLTEAAVQRGGDTLRAAAPPATALRLTLSGSPAHPRLAVAPGP